MGGAIVRRLALTGSRWPLWATFDVVGGLVCAGSEWLLLGNPGIRGTLAALIGSVVGCLGYDLVRGTSRGSDCGFGACWVAGMPGAKGASILLTIGLALAFSVVSGLVSRMLWRALPPTKVLAASPPGSDPLGFDELQRCWDEIRIESDGPWPTRDELHDRHEH